MSALSTVTLCKASQLYGKVEQLRRELTHELYSGLVQQKKHAVTAANPTQLIGECLKHDHSAITHTAVMKTFENLARLGNLEREMESMKDNREKQAEYLISCSAVWSSSSSMPLQQQIRPHAS